MNSVLLSTMVSPVPASVFFPSAHDADSDGLIGIGGELTPIWILDAYLHGIFPWPLDGGQLAWWSPDPRAILELDQLHVSRRLARTIRTGGFQTTRDLDFCGVLTGCATAQDREGRTWITSDIVRGYGRLHELGVAHSVEVWREGQLAGGIYGLALGAMFSAESMFYRVRDASKVALAHLVDHLRQRGYMLLDIQQLTPHTRRLGAREIPRSEFLARLGRAVERDITFEARPEAGGRSPEDSTRGKAGGGRPEE